jgi:hypothetical protein
MRVFVLCVRRYSFTSDDGQNLSGISCLCIGDSSEQTANFKGKQPMKLTTSDMTIWNHFGVVPGYYELDVAYSANSKGEVKFRLNAAKYLQEVKQ